jgi:signal transduction histidine kinase
LAAPPAEPAGPLQTHRWLAALAGLIALHIANPLTWGAKLPGAWDPTAGIGLVLVAWLGVRASWLVVLDGYLVVLLAWLVGGSLPWSETPYGWFLAAANPLLSAGEVALAWELFHRHARGSRRLLDPHSASIFLLLVPGAVAGVFALARALVLAPASFGSLWDWTAAFWLSRALGFLGVAPALLVTATPWFVRQGITPREQLSQERSPRLSVHMNWGDYVEMIGIAIGTAVLGAILVWLHYQESPVGWKDWVLPLLLIVWASLRQSIRGGTIAAGVSATISLVWVMILRRGWELESISISPLQGYFLAQCCTALLVGASFDWIHASEFRYRQVVGHIPVVLYSARLAERNPNQIRPSEVEITFASPASQQLLGCPPDELLQSYSAWLDRVHVDDRELVLAALAQLRQYKQPVTYEYRIKSRIEDRGTKIDAAACDPRSSILDSQRSTRWVRDTLVPLVDSQGRLVGWEGVLTEITEQRNLADDLRRTTNMLHTLVASLPAGVFFVHVPSGRPILVNARARKLLGQREDPAAGLSLWPTVYRLFKPDGSRYPAEELPVALALKRGATAMRDDIIVHRPDGRKVPLIAWGAPIDLAGKGEPDAAVWVLEDLTTLRNAEAAERRAQEELQRAQRLELAGRMAGGIVHDFNNLLTVIINLAEMGRQALPAQHPVAEDLRGISEASEQASYLVRQLLTFGKQQHVCLHKVALEQIARRSLDLLRGSLSPRITVEFVAPETDLFVEGNETQLQQILMNLCFNARDAMPESGRLKVAVISSAKGPASQNGQAGWIRLSVSDSGQGIPESVRARIFDPFFSTKPTGTGLGLAVVQQIVASHSGHIEVESKEGAGTRFDVWLPRAERE